jgi:hypothetical protein
MVWRAEQDEVVQLDESRVVVIYLSVQLIGYLGKGKTLRYTTVIIFDHQ